ncbi:MAG TPA: hypothetical protein VF269_07565 [Rhodanobacteraceae bacterium]
MTTWADAGRLVQILTADALDILRPQRKHLAQRRAQWGQPGQGEGLFAQRYFDRVRQQAPDRHVDDKTWDDLEFPALFAHMDTTQTAPGRQVLYHRLRTPLADAAVLASRHAAAQRLRDDPLLRECIQRRLLRLEGDGSEDLADDLFGDPPTPGRHYGWLIAWAVVALAILALVWPLGLPAWLFVPVLGVNWLVSMAGTLGKRQQIEALTNSLTLAAVADQLATLRGQHDALPSLQALVHEAPARRAFRRALGRFRLVFSLDAAQVPVVAQAANLVKSLLLIDVLVCGHAIRRFGTVRDKLRASFVLVGEIDASIAVASWLVQQRVHCRPTLAADASLMIEGGVHPLIAEGVSNTMAPGQRSALVTGSNMAGKTTFIKMLGMNVILGRTLGICTACAATLPAARVMASIHNRHSVGSGKSHYFAEVEAIAGFLARATPDNPHLFLIDEPFSGTNTVERIAIARAVLEALGRHARVFVTTHDVELQALLGDGYGLYHFQEDPNVEGFFDYRLRAGATREHNAIALLDRIGFPAPVVAAALCYAGVNAGDEVVVSVD